MNRTMATIGPVKTLIFGLQNQDPVQNAARIHSITRTETTLLMSQFLDISREDERRAIDQ